MSKSIFPSDRDSCLRAIKAGGIATMISAAVTLILTLIGFMSILTIIDAALTAILGVFIFLKSRIAATIMFVYFTISKINIWTATGSVRDLPLAAIFFFFFLIAMIATFKWHKLYKQQNK